MKKTFLWLVLLSTLNPPLSTCFAQGPLTPPGPPAPTFKTLDQVEPRIDLQNAPGSAVDSSNATYHFIINQPGSYYLSANLVVTKTSAIRITVEGVSLDLNGFQISRASGFGGSGVELTSTAHRAFVRNGSIKGFAIGVLNPSADDCEFRDLTITACTISGLQAGRAGIIRSCHLDGNTGTGIVAGQGSVITDCTVLNHGGTSNCITAGNGSTLRNCSVTVSTAANAFSVGRGATLSDCTANNNGVTVGFSIGAGSTVKNCAASANASSASSSAGFSVDGGSVLLGCSASSNTSSATATANTGMGFELFGAGITIENCTALANRGDGIRLFSSNVARGNNCLGNGVGHGAGIHAVGGFNRIEANNVVSNERGIDVDLAGNMIIKNSASGNTTNYDFVAGNVFGVIVDRATPGSGVVNGNTAPSSMGTTDPWANIVY